MPEAGKENICSVRKVATLLILIVSLAYDFHYDIGVP